MDNYTRHFTDWETLGTGDTLIPGLLLKAQRWEWPDFLTTLLLLWLYVWYTDCWGRWSKPDPLLFVPVKDRQAFESQSGKSRNIKDALKEIDVLVFWGSQSGRAEKLSGNFARECSARYGLSVAAADLDDYDHETLTEVSSSKVLVFIISTFGEGDPTDNSYSFCAAISSLKQQAHKASLQHLRYAAFGLGNRNYKHFNKIIDVVDETFQAIGGQRLGLVGRADEAKGGMSTDEDFMEWKESAFEGIRQKFGVEETPAVYNPGVEIVASEVERSKLYRGEQPAQGLNRGGQTKADRSKPFVAPITTAKDLATDPMHRCIHVEVDVTGARVRYQSGDHLAVWPVNPDEEVDRLCRLLGLSEKERTTPIEVRSVAEGKPVPVPSPTTREAILRYYLDICGPVSRDTLRLLPNYCPTPEASEMIARLSKDKDKFKTQVTSQLLTIGKVIELAGASQVWKSLPFSLLVESLGKLQPRYYSVASSPSISPNQAAITVAATSRIFSTRKGQENRFYGLSSNYLLAVERARKQPNEVASGVDRKSGPLDGPHYQVSGGTVLVQLRRSTFKLPPNSKRPIIMVGAGTGIAPFRGFVQERAAMAGRDIPIGPMLLLFGCRSPTEGFLYAGEWGDYQKRLPEFQFETAFSRVGNKKKYVQDRLMELKERVAELLEQGAIFYICGSADMARNVRNRLTDILASSKGWSEVQAERYLMGEMKSARLLQEDVWSG